MQVQAFENTFILTAPCSIQSVYFLSMKHDGQQGGDGRVLSVRMLYAQQLLEMQR
jgi:hypothetical protein